MNKLVVAVSVVIAAAAVALVISQFVEFPLSEPTSNSPKAEVTQQPTTNTVNRDGLSDTAFQIGQINITKGAVSELSLPDLFNTTQQSVVQITDSSNSDPSNERLGSGFVYDNNGHIITNNHVVSISGSLAVTFLDGTIYRAQVIGSDPYTDLSVLYVPNVPSNKLVPLPLADSTRLRVGQQVAAIGNPFGLSGSMSEGIISGLGRLLPDDQAGQYSIPDVIQTDAPVNPGNSGGPLLDLHGKVVGITTAIYTNTGQFSGVGFAIPANTISKIIPSLITTGSFQHPWLGISGRDMTPELAQAIGLKEPRGFLIIDIVAGSPADKAGIKGGSKAATVDGVSVKLGGDVIVDIDDKPVRKIDDILTYMESQKSVGDPIKLTVFRDGKTLSIATSLGARPGQTVSP